MTNTDFAVPPELPLIELYEDNAGGLYLHAQGTDTVYTGLQFVENASFAADAAALAEGDTASWSLLEAALSDLSAPTVGLVATWDGGPVMHIVRPSDMGTAARLYIGIAAEEDES